MPACQHTPFAAIFSGILRVWADGFLRRRAFNMRAVSRLPMPANPCRGIVFGQIVSPDILKHTSLATAGIHGEPSQNQALQIFSGQGIPDNSGRKHRDYSGKIQAMRIVAFPSSSRLLDVGLASIPAVCWNQGFDRLPKFIRNPQVLICGMLARCLYGSSNGLSGKHPVFASDLFVDKHLIHYRSLKTAQRVEKTTDPVGLSDFYGLNPG